MIIPRPTHNEYLLPHVEERVDSTKDYGKHCAWVKWFFEQKPWKCDVCGAAIVFLCDYCVFCKIEHHRHTPRPSKYQHPPTYPNP